MAGLTPNQESLRLLVECAKIQSGRKNTYKRSNRIPLKERLWEATVVDPARGCWLYTGNLGKEGYLFPGNSLHHRKVYEALCGSIPAGLEIDHACRNRHCLNPLHLNPVTHERNLELGELDPDTHFNLMVRTT